MSCPASIWLEELRAQLLALEASAKAGAEAEEEALRLRTVERSAGRVGSALVGLLKRYTLPI